MAFDGINFTQGDAEASSTFPKQSSSLRKGGHVMINNRPCKIVEMSTSKTGKHGHAKVNLVGLDIFTGKKLEDICPSSHNMLVPEVKRTEYQLNYMLGEFLALLDNNGRMRGDIRCPEDKLGDDIKNGMENDCEMMVTVLSAEGEEMVVAAKVTTNKDIED